MIPQSVKSKIIEIYQDENELAKELVELWLNDIIFTFHWWVAFLIVSIAWLIWFRYHDKKNIHALMYAGLFVAIAASYLDFLGIQAGLWMYYIKLLPTIPGFFIWDISLLPIEVMLLIQIKPNVNPYLKALFHSLVTSLIFEPLFIWIGFYEPIHWKSLYSIPIQFIIFIIAYKLYKSASASKKILCC